eukprot:gene9007-18647_t
MSQLLFSLYWLHISFILTHISAKDLWNDRSFNYSIDLKLLDPYGQPKDNFGRSVSISQTIALIGAPEEGTTENSQDSGQVMVFSLKYNQWNIIRYISDGVPGDYFGWSVALDSSMTAVIGAWRDNTNGGYSGAAYVFDIETNVNKPQSNGTKLMASNSQTAAYFGYSVAISQNEDKIPVVLVGAYGSGGVGEAYVFSKSKDTSQWYEVARLSAYDGYPSDRFGWSVDIFRNELIVGAPLHNNNGAAYIFSLIKDEDDAIEGDVDIESGTYSWTFNQRLDQTNATLKSSKGNNKANNNNNDDDNDDAMSYDYFGMSVAIGKGVVAVGAPGSNYRGLQTGAVFVYSDIYTDTYIDPDDADDDDEEEEEDDDTVDDSGKGSGKGTTVRSRKTTASQDTEIESSDELKLMQVLTAPDYGSLSRFGWSMSHDSSKNRFIVGTDMARSKDTGAAYIFRLQPDVSHYFLEKELRPEDDRGNLMFGVSCDVDGDHAIVGASKGTGVTPLSGSAYHYKAQ